MQKDAKEEGKQKHNNEDCGSKSRSENEEGSDRNIKQWAYDGLQLRLRKKRSCIARWLMVDSFTGPVDTSGFLLRSASYILM